VTKSRNIGRGGARRGSGRPPGAKNRRTTLLEILPKLAEEDEPLPLYALLARTRDPGLDDRYKDALRIAILPFLHPRPRSDLTAKPSFLMSDEELQQVRDAEIQHEKELRKGRHLHLIKEPK
jgi:hypothetical protein